MNYAAIVKAIQSANSRLQDRVATVANQALVLRYWLVGAYLIDFEQNGKERVKYGDRLLENVCGDLNTAGVRGFTAAMLRACRLAYFVYPQFRQTLSVEFATALRDPIRGTLPPEWGLEIPATSSPKSRSLTRPTPSAELRTLLTPEALFHLSLSKLVALPFISKSTTSGPCSGPPPSLIP